MRLYFIRHAQSVNNLLWDTTGSSNGRSEDPELTELGFRQAQILGEYIVNVDQMRPDHPQKTGYKDEFGFTHCYCSPMIRAVETGLAVSRAIHLPLVIWKDLHETGGIYLDGEESGEEMGLPGNSRSYLEKRFPDLILTEDIQETGWWNRPYEEKEERMPRAHRFVQELLKRHGATDDRVAVFSHGAFFNYMLSVFINHTKQERAWFLLNNCSISRFDIRGDWFTMMYTNRFSHLPEEMIT